MRYLMLTICVVVAGCAAQSPQAQPGDATVAVADERGVQPVEIVGAAYYFDPGHVVVRVNEPVELHLSKEGLLPHDLVLVAEEAGIDIEVELGSTTQAVRFTPTSTGRYTFYCSKSFLGRSHRERGMQGVLEVRE